MRTASPSGLPVVLFCCQAPFLDHDASQVRELAKSARVHVVFEVTPHVWETNVLGLPRANCASGVHEVSTLVQKGIPAGVWRCLERAESLWYSVYPKISSIGTVTTEVAMVRLVRRLRPDVVHLDSDSRRSVPWVSLLGRLPYVLSVHEARVPDGGSGFALAWAKSRLIRGAAALIAFSEQGERQLHCVYGEHLPPITTVPLCSKEAITYYGDPALSESTRPTVLCIGWLAKRKGLDVLLQASELLQAGLPSLRVVVAGRPGGDYDEVKAAIHAADCVEMIPRFLSPDELADLVRQSWVVVAPYLKATQSGAVLTAYAFRKPVVASDTGGLREQVWEGETGFLVPPGDPQALANRLREVLVDPLLRDRMQHSIEQRASRELSAERFASASLKAYRTLHR